MLDCPSILSLFGSLQFEDVNLPRQYLGISDGVFFHTSAAALFYAKKVGVYVRNHRKNGIRHPFRARYLDLHVDMGIRFVKLFDLAFDLIYVSHMILSLVASAQIVTDGAHIHLLDNFQNHGAIGFFALLHDLV